MNPFELKHNGELIFTGTENECYMKLQRVQSQSADWAMKYEGYTITAYTAKIKETSKKYYADQLANLLTEETMSIHIVGKTKETNPMALNDESASVLVEWLRDNFSVHETSKTFGGNWSTEDVKSRSAEVFDVELREDQAREVIDIIEKNFDATVGVNWDIIDEAIEKYIKE